MLNLKGEIDMKKVLSVVLAVMMLALIAVPSFAATVTTAGATDVIVKTSTTKEDGTSGENYSIDIPADTVIPWGTEATDVSYTVEAHLARNKGVKVVVAGTGAMKTTDGAYSLAYALEGADAFLATSPVVYDEATDSGVKQDLKVKIDSVNWKKAVVEEYSDTLTYTVSVEAI